MAQIFPPFKSHGDQRGERIVFDVLQKLPDDWMVFYDYWALYQVKDDYVNFEADFIVLVPGRGIVTVEVKDWRNARIRNGIWEHQPGGDGAAWVSLGKKQSPLNQAFLCSKRLMKGLVEAQVVSADSKYQPEFRCMAVLTNCVPVNFAEDAIEQDQVISGKSNVPLDTLYVCGSAALHDNLEARIDSLFVHKGRYGKNMTPELMQALKNYLAPSIMFRRDFESYLQIMEDAGADIANLLPLLEESTGGVRVEGCAGSGKTVMACRELARLAALHGEDKRFLMLCYNLNLCDSLRRDPALHAFEGRNLTISNFHEYCIEHALIPAGRQDLISTADKARFFGEPAYPAIREYLSTQPPYDYIFVDEAQDFKEAWWDIVRTCLAPLGKLYIFADANQSIYDHRSALPELPTRVHLRRNLRNAQEIAAFSAAMLPEGETMEPLKLGGAQVQIAPGSDDPAARADTVRAIIQAILARDDIHAAPSDIAVLTPWRVGNKRRCLGFLTDVLDTSPDEGETNGEMWARLARCTAPGSTRIYGDTIKRFKGLEAPFVILADIPGLQESRGFDMDDLYVGATRAKFGLFIVPTVSGESLAKQFLQ